MEIVSNHVTIPDKMNRILYANDANYSSMGEVESGIFQCKIKQTYSTLNPTNSAGILLRVRVFILNPECI